jgi:hypothetical protein
MNHAHVYAVLTWLYSAGFGLATIPVARFLLRRGRLPIFAGLFEAYGGPWFARFPARTFALILMTFLIVTLLAAWGGWEVWTGSKSGAILSLALLPIEAIFWIGFALPIPWIIGVARITFLVLAWQSLS